MRIRRGDLPWLGCCAFWVFALIAVARFAWDLTGAIVDMLERMAL